MTPAEAVAALDALDASDPESAHGRADEILLALLPLDVMAAYLRVTVRAPWWATA